MVIDVKPATTLAEAACQMEEAMGMCEGHYVMVCDVVLSNWSIVCRSVDINALLKLADEMDRSAHESEAYFAGVHPVDIIEYVRRIREALGVDRPKGLHFKEES